MAEKAVVFVGLHEHHSNILPWREAGVDVVTIGETEDGIIDLGMLEVCCFLVCFDRRRL